jgi:large subunit ribosomal protein L13
MAKIILDADNSAMGRVASFAAKSALLGNEIAILNSEKAIISGRKVDVIEDYKERRTLNHMNPEKGPFFSKSTEKILKRAIRGMLPDFRRGRGKEAWRRVRCYNGIPEEFKKEKIINLKLKEPRTSITLKELKEKV